MEEIKTYIHPVYKIRAIDTDGKTWLKKNDIIMQICSIKTLRQMKGRQFFENNFAPQYISLDEIAELRKKNTTLEANFSALEKEALLVQQQKAALCEVSTPNPTLSDLMREIGQIAEAVNTISVVGRQQDLSGLHTLAAIAAKHSMTGKALREMMVADGYLKYHETMLWFTDKYKDTMGLGCLFPVWSKNDHSRIITWSLYLTPKGELLCEECINRHAK